MLLLPTSGCVAAGSHCYLSLLVTGAAFYFPTGAPRGQSSGFSASCHSVTSLVSAPHRLLWVPLGQVFSPTWQPTVSLFPMVLQGEDGPRDGHRALLLSITVLQLLTEMEVARKLEALDIQGAEASMHVHAREKSGTHTPTVKSSA